MGFRYSYEMWVPQERLYGFLELLNKFVDKDSSTTLRWPDGRSLELFGTDFNGRKIEEVVLNCSIQSLPMALVFETDEFLNGKYDHYSRYDNQSPISERERCSIGIIYLRIALSPENTSWLDSEGEYALVSFTGATSGISSDMCSSPTIRQAMVNLARNSGAVSCTGDDEIIYLDGQEINEEWEGIDYPWSGYLHFRDLRQHLNPTKELSENEKILQICQLSEELTQSDLMQRLDWAKNSADSGIRAAAIKSIRVSLTCNEWRENKDDPKVREAILKSLTEVEDAGVEEAICKIALNDERWKVRYVAINCLEEFASESSEKILSHLTQDEHYEIRTIAAKVLQRRQRDKD